jgi:hypothetical protein
MKEKQRYYYEYYGRWPNHIGYDYDIIDSGEGIVVFSTNSPVRVKYRLEELNNSTNA